MQWRSRAQFLSRDPLVAQTREPYAYALDDPLNGVDPSGLYDYQYSFRLGPVASLGSAANAMSYFESHASSVFPFSLGGCSSISLGETCDLAAQYFARRPGGIFGNAGFNFFGDAPVCVSQVTSTSFTFTSLPGHFDGPGGTITFTTYASGGQLFLQQTAHAPNASGLTNILAPVAAYPVWQQQAQNLAAALAPRSSGPPNGWPGWLPFNPMVA